MKRKAEGRGWVKCCDLKEIGWLSRGVYNAALLSPDDAPLINFVALRLLYLKSTTSSILFLLLFHSWSYGKQWSLSQACFLDN